MSLENAISPINFAPSLPSVSLPTPSFSPEISPVSFQPISFSPEFSGIEALNNSFELTAPSFTKSTISHIARPEFMFDMRSEINSISALDRLDSPVDIVSEINSISAIDLLDQPVNPFLGSFIDIESVIQEAKSMSVRIVDDIPQPISLPAIFNVFNEITSEIITEEALPDLQDEVIEQPVFEPIQSEQLLIKEVPDSAVVEADLTSVEQIEQAAPIEEVLKNKVKTNPEEAQVVKVVNSFIDAGMETEKVLQILEPTLQEKGLKVEVQTQADGGGSIIIITKTAAGNGRAIPEEIQPSVFVIDRDALRARERVGDAAIAKTFKDHAEENAGVEGWMIADEMVHAALYDQSLKSAANAISDPTPMLMVKDIAKSGPIWSADRARKVISKASRENTPVVIGEGSPVSQEKVEIVMNRPTQNYSGHNLLQGLDRIIKEGTLRLSPEMKPVLRVLEED